MTTKSSAAANLPPTLVPRGLRREQAAAYLGVSARMFDEMVAQKLMPRAKRIGAARVWDRLQLDDAFVALGEEGESRPRSIWDEVT